MSDKFMIGSNDTPEIVERNIDDLASWEFNPRTVDEKAFARLIEQIKLLGVYKPLLINQDNIVLGGNMRLQALKTLGVKKTLCCLVRTDNEAQKMDYALSDNDQIGTTDEQKLAEYISKHRDVKSDLFAINSQPMKLVSSVLKQFEPSDDEKEKSGNYTIKVTFSNMEALEKCLIEIQEITEKYGKDFKGIIVNDDN